MATNKEELIRAMPKERLEAIVIDAHTQFGQMQNQLNLAREEASNAWKLNKIVKRDLENTQAWAGFYLIFSVIMTTLFFLSIFGVI